MTEFVIRKNPDFVLTLKVDDNYLTLRLFNLITDRVENEFGFSKDEAVRIFKVLNDFEFLGGGNDRQK